MCVKMSMYRSYFLKKEFWAKKGNEKDPDSEKVYIRHDELGGIYAIIQTEKRGVKIIANRKEYFFDNFDKLDFFLNSRKQKQDNFVKILKRKNISKKLRTLEI